MDLGKPGLDLDIKNAATQYGICIEMTAYFVEVVCLY